MQICAAVAHASEHIFCVLYVRHSLTIDQNWAEAAFQYTYKVVFLCVRLSESDQTSFRNVDLALLLPYARGERDQ